VDQSAPMQPAASQPATPRPVTPRETSAPRVEQHTLAASATDTAVADAPQSAPAGRQRIEVNSDPEPDDQMHMLVREEPQVKEQKSPNKSLAEIESQLTPFADGDESAVEEPDAGRAQMSPEDAAESASQFADAFEVPRVVGMQKSLRVKKKKKKFFLFRWFSRNKE